MVKQRLRRKEKSKTSTQATQKRAPVTLRAVLGERIKIFFKKKKYLLISFFCIAATCFFVSWDIAWISGQYSLNKQEKLAWHAVQELQNELDESNSMAVSEIWLNYLEGQTGISITYSVRQDDGNHIQRTQIVYFEDGALRKGPCTYTEEELRRFKQTAPAEEYIRKLWCANETRTITDCIRANGGLQIDAEKMNRFLQRKQAAFWMQRLPAWLRWYWSLLSATGVTLG